ncbi:hypothetical protein MACJ_002604 [Theileria orientalis]|uniref:PHD-type domain-containing protein n=1 Tax=Theileria orientalis TaxID=68886 RepID=A0A976M8U6_THEOR|nr:hypothetical protein MACJ_002604 [Theileria orientalis]
MNKKKKLDSNADIIAENRKLCLTCYSKTCEDIFDTEKLICCTKCRQCFHSSCYDPPLAYEVVIRYPWHCKRCKVCVNCDEHKDGTLIICDACDRGFHMDCINDILEEIPSGSWYCYDCQYCKLCYNRLTDSEARSDWYSLEGNKFCRDCLELRNIKDISIRVNFCCVCSKPMDSSNSVGNGRITCSKCTQGSHTKCSRREKGYRDNFQVLNWICNNCLKVESWRITID